MNQHTTPTAFNSGFVAGFNFATAKHEALRSSCQALIDQIKRFERLRDLVDAIDHELHQLNNLEPASEL